MIRKAMVATISLANWICETVGFAAEQRDDPEATGAEENNFEDVRTEMTSIASRSRSESLSALDRAALSASASLPVSSGEKPRFEGGIMFSITSTADADPNQKAAADAEFAAFLADMSLSRKKSRNAKNQQSTTSNRSLDCAANKTTGGGGQKANATDRRSLKSPMTEPNDLTLLVDANSGSHQHFSQASDTTVTKIPLSTFNSTTPSIATGSGIMTINVAGLVFQTLYETVEKYPDTLLGNAKRRYSHFNPTTGEFFFDRHRRSFEAILHYYQNDGVVKRPPHVPVDVFLRELRFYDLGDAAIEKFWISEGYKKPAPMHLPTNKLQRQVYQLMEIPDSSLWARLIAFVSVSIIVLSTVSFCLETLPSIQDRFKPRNKTTETANGTIFEIEELQTDPFFVLEIICITWFTLEFCLRFASCPSKCDFIKSFLNWVDFVAIVPFFINLAFQGGDAEKAEKTTNTAMSFAVLRVLRLVRVFRIFKLSRHSRGLQILGLTFKASVQELCLLVFFLMIGLVLFSSAVYFAEHGEPGTKFSSIPAAFWYAIVTMTTVGYGDLTPVGPWGKLVGSMCAIVGVLVLALPVPVIVANFKHYYRQEARLANMRCLEDNEEQELEYAESDSS